MRTTNKAFIQRESQAISIIPATKNIIKVFFLFFCLLSISSCIRNNEVIGIYASIGYNNTYDTIILNNKSVYERKIYDKNRKLVLQMTGNWEFEDGKLKMNSFFLNLDRDVVLYPELLSDTSMEMQTLIERQSNSLVFCTGYLDNENCYKKIE